MSKQKIITLLIVILILLVSGALFLYGQKEKIYPFSLITPADDTSLPQIKNKERIEGRKDDLVAFSLSPDMIVSGLMSYRGTIKGGYFFEGNILINILDQDKNVLKKSNAIAKTDWQTGGPVDFEGNIDFSDIRSGPIYFEIKNDNASGISANDKNILIPLVVK